MRWYLIVLMTSVALAACGDTETSENSTNNTTNPNSVNSTNNLNSTNNTNNINNTNGVPGPDVVEVEPNNSQEMGTPFAVGQSFGGTITASTETASDQDYFRVQLTPGRVFEIELAHSTALDARIDIIDPTGFFVRLDKTRGTTRRFFVAMDGFYYVRVRDARYQGAAHGGSGFEYVVASRYVTVAPQSVELPFNATGDLSGGLVDIYAITPSEDIAIDVQTIAKREPIASALDTVLIVWNAEDGQLGRNDDIDFQAMNTDSRAFVRVKAGVETWIVVQGFLNTPDGGYGLTAKMIDDAPTAPYPLVPGDSVSGVIGEGGDFAFDRDYFTVALQPGETARVEVAATGTEIQPALSVYFQSQFAGPVPIAFSDPVQGRSAAEFTNGDSEPDEFFVVIDDTLNIPTEGDPAQVGGDVAEYGYEVTVSLTTWEPQPLTLPFVQPVSIPDVGEYVWWQTAVPANHFFAAVVGTTSELEPRLYQINDAGVAEAFVGVMIPTAETPLEFGVRDRYFRGGAGFTGDASIVAVDLDTLVFNGVVDTEPNDTVMQAQPLTLPAEAVGIVDGTFEAVNPDAYALNLAAGELVGFYTLTGGQVGGDADTMVTVIAPDGATMLENDDYPGQLPQYYFSGGVFRAVDAGTYTIIVKPFCAEDDNPCQGAGDYALRVINP